MFTARIESEMFTARIESETFTVRIDFDLIFGVLAPLSTIFQLYHGDQF